MDRPISRRDFVNGVAAASAATALPSWVYAESGANPTAQSHAPAQDHASAQDYPPARMGLRGSHPGSFEAAHELRDRRSLDTASALRTGETYDLIVVGAGLSGL